MSEAIGQILPLAIGVALSPIPIIAVVLMLGTPAGSRNGPAFVAGWIVGLSVAGALVLVLSSSSASDGGDPADWVSWVELVLGLLLLVVAGRQWHARPVPGAELELPGWMHAIDRFTSARSAAMAVALSAINPKNLLLVIAAAAAIAQTGIPAGEQAVSLAIFVVLGAVGPAAPVVVYFTMRDRAIQILAELKDWMSRSNAVIMAVICLVLAAKLIGGGISGLG